MPLREFFRLVGTKNSYFIACRESRQGYFMLWDKKMPSRNTLKIVCFHRLSERDLIIRLYAEDHHVVEVVSCLFYFVFRRWLVLSENMARWEYVPDSIDNNTERGEGKVAGIVLPMLAECNENDSTTYNNYDSARLQHLLESSKKGVGK